MNRWPSAGSRRRLPCDAAAIGSGGLIGSDGQIGSGGQSVAGLHRGPHQRSRYQHSRYQDTRPTGVRQD